MIVYYTEDYKKKIVCVPFAGEPVNLLFSRHY